MGSYFNDNAGHVRPVWRTEGGGERLRPAQVGAAFNLVGHFTVSAEPGQVVMPTGSGKTAVMALIPYLAPTRRALVVAPSRLVRDQIAEEFRALARLQATGAAPSGMPPPRVEVVRHRLATLDDWSQLGDADVVVGTPMCLSPALEGVAVPPHDLFDLVLLDVVWQGQDSNLCRRSRRFYRPQTRLPAGPLPSPSGPDHCC
jgi:DEAD/DEAH box helicase